MIRKKKTHEKSWRAIQLSCYQLKFSETEAHYGNWLTHIFHYSSESIKQNATVTNKNVQRPKTFWVLIMTKIFQRKLSTQRINSSHGFVHTTPTESRLQKRCWNVSFETIIWIHISNIFIKWVEYDLSNIKCMQPIEGIEHIGRIRLVLRLAYIWKFTIFAHIPNMN